MLWVYVAPSTAATADLIAPEDCRIGQHGDAITGHLWRTPQGGLWEDCCVVHVTRGGLQEHLRLLPGLGTELEQLPHHLQGRHCCFCCVRGAASEAAPALRCPGWRMSCRAAEALALAMGIKRGMDRHVSGRCRR